MGPVDIELCFPAYVSSFDGDDDDDDDGEPDLLRVPHWVAQWVKPAGRAVESNKRPSNWYTVPALNDQDIAPTDASYQFSQSFRRSHPNWYDRGHLAQKYLTERFGEEAGRFSHSVANAVPQRSRFNSHPWLELECRTGAWANRYRGLWVVTGPVFLNSKPTAWLTEPGRRGALPVAIPDALFKVVVRKRSDRLDWLAFLYPQDSPSP